MSSFKNILYINILIFLSTMIDFTLSAYKYKREFVSLQKLRLFFNPDESNRLNNAELNGIFEVQLLKGKPLYFKSKNGTYKNFPFYMPDTFTIDTRKKVIECDFLGNKKTAYYLIKQNYHMINLYVKMKDFKIKNEKMSLPDPHDQPVTNFVYPLKEQYLTLQMAIKQTYFAKKLIYLPSQGIINEITAVAVKIGEILTLLEKDGPKAEAEFFRIVFDIKNEESVNENKEAVRRLALSLSEDYNHQSRLNEIKKLLKLLRNIGKGFTKSKKDPAFGEQFKDMLIRYFPNQNLINTLDHHFIIYQCIGGNFSLYKKAEQIEAPSDSELLKKKLTGIYGIGKLIDEKLFPNINNKQPADNWPVCIFDANLVKGIKEPLGCHISSSYITVFYSMNLLLNVNTEKLFHDQVTKEDLAVNPHYSIESVSNRALIIIANMLANGYHSAIEVVEQYFLSIGINLRDDERKYDFYIPFTDQSLYDFKYFNSGYSTDLICNLLNKATTAPNELLNEPLTLLDNRDLMNEISTGKHLEGSIHE